MNNLTEKESMIIEFQTMFCDDVIETLVAFANTVGGTVYIGIAVNGEINGLTINEETLELWNNTIRSSTTPRLLPECKILTIEDKLVVSVHIDSSKFKPISFKGRFFKRIGSINQFMSAEEITIEYLRTKNLLHHNTHKEKTNTPKTKKEKAKKIKVFDYRETIVKLIMNDKHITLNEIANKIEMSQKSVERSIKKLKADGVIDRVGHDRGGYWRIMRYEV